MTDEATSGDLSDEMRLKMCHLLRSCERQISAGEVTGIALLMAYRGGKHVTVELKGRWSLGALLGAVDVVHQLYDATEERAGGPDVSRMN
jgi:hypothetical protein